MKKEEIKPQVGMGATEILWSDRKPYTVIEVLSEKKIVVQSDSYKRIDTNGMSDCQEYEYSRNPNGCTVTLSKRKDGRWRVVGKKDMVFAVGFRNKYHDFSF